LFIYPGFTFGIVDALMTNFTCPSRLCSCWCVRSAAATVCCRESRALRSNINFFQLRRRHLIV
jgi:S-adenosylmethionine:tRNA-ribosyltransferase-isomerase (queuine synthetase)